jgi:signal transduction histidine kinase
MESLMSDPVRSADVAVTLESVLRTEQLRLRPTRAPDYETENGALLAIAQHMADSPRVILQKLAETALQICHAGSAGVSLLSEETGDFYWPAVAGAWKGQIGGGTPRNFGPCGVVLDRNSVQLFTHPERYYPYLVPVTPPIEEALLTPFSVNGVAVGTVWVIAHEASRKFDAEDVRLVESLGRFAGAAYPLYAALDVQELQSHSLRDVNEGLLVSSVRQHELTEKAQKAEVVLRRANEDLEQFGYSASHDLQAPIRNISIYGELLGNRYGHLLDAQGKIFLAIIIDGAKRMEMLLKDLRSYAQSGGTLDELREEVHTDDVLVKALADLSSAIGESGAKITHSDLPTIRAYEVQLEQIFQNLIGNAIKYRQDEEPPCIHISANRQQDEWIFSVRDNGIGIAAEHQETIFGIFKRLHGDEKYAGNGIGLAICQKLVERTGGRIWVQSEGKAKGSTFYFTMPAGA